MSGWKFRFFSEKDNEIVIILRLEQNVKGESEGFFFSKGMTTVHCHTHHTRANRVSRVLLKAPANVNHFQVRLDGFSRKEKNEECTGNRFSYVSKGLSW